MSHEQTPPHPNPLPEGEGVTEPPLTQAYILRFFLPLEASWLLMAAEWPVILALVARLPDETVTIAALGIVMNLSLWIESPVIPLLATSTALAVDRGHLLVLRRFVIHLIAWVTAVHVLVSWTPLYWLVVEGAMGVPPDIAQAVRPGLLIMTPWSGLIAWRRFLQGILIRHGRTALVGAGTVVRLIAMAATGAALFAAHSVPGVWVGAFALIAGVAAEAVYAHWASRRLVRDRLAAEPAPSNRPLSYKRLVSFHTPLALTTALALCSGPIISAALARGSEPLLALAAWPVVSALLFLNRTVAMALPEAVIALQRNRETAVALSRFSVGLAIFASGTLALAALTGLDGLFFTRVLGVPPEAASMAHIGAMAALLIPGISALQAYTRGMLTAGHLTMPLFPAMAVFIACLFAGLAAGLNAGLPGVQAAGLAITTALAAEYAFLGLARRRAGVAA